MLKKILYIVLILGLAAFGLGYYFWNKPPRDIASAQVDIFIAATDFYKAYSTDEAGSNAKYLDKVIAVEGVVSLLELDNPEEPTVALATESAEATIRCGFKKELMQEVKKIKAGDKIKIKGKCVGIDLFGSVVITQCSLIN